MARGWWVWAVVLSAVSSGLPLAEKEAAEEEEEEAPVVRTLDVSRIVRGEATAEDARALSEATATLGLFNIVNHGIPDEVLARFDAATRALFALPQAEKDAVRRTRENAYGYANDELTKQTRDRKELFDYGSMPGGRGLPADAPENVVADGWNRLPPRLLVEEIIAGSGGGRGAFLFHDAVGAYYDACAHVSRMLLRALAQATGGLEEDAFERFFGAAHSSYLRLNRYPVLGPDEVAFADHDANLDEATSETRRAVLGVNRHFDAGALTILRQDPAVKRGLQVNLRSHQSSSARGHEKNTTAFPSPRWVDVFAEDPAALTVNIGDMLQVLSNDRYRAPEHRVLASTGAARFSAPFFYNPAFDATIEPIYGAHAPRYRPFTWLHFRTGRFQGDHADIGAPDIQIAGFRIEDQTEKNPPDDDDDDDDDHDHDHHDDDQRTDSPPRAEL